MNVLLNKHEIARFCRQDQKKCQIYVSRESSVALSVEGLLVYLKISTFDGISLYSA